MNREFEPAEAEVEEESSWPRSVLARSRSPSNQIMGLMHERLVLEAPALATTYQPVANFAFVHAMPLVWVYPRLCYPRLDPRNCGLGDRDRDALLNFGWTLEELWW